MAQQTRRWNPSDAANAFVRGVDACGCEASHQRTCSQGIVAEQLTLHADRGTSMKSKPLAMLLSDLGVTKTHRRS